MFFFFNDTATTEIYTLSLHDALPISQWEHGSDRAALLSDGGVCWTMHQTLTCELEDFLLERSNELQLDQHGPEQQDRKSTRLNSSHGYISYAVFCLKKKNEHRERLHD